MLEQLVTIMEFVVNAFLHTWPYLVITIPIAAAVQLSGASKHIGKAFKARPVTAILLATLVGAFSPFCSCGVIPVVAAMLIGGVPLAPVMAFWIASPSMDPEIFFLSVATIGWQLAIWRLAATLVLSLSAGFITHLLISKGWLGSDILKIGSTGNVSGTGALVKKLGRRVKQWFQTRLFPVPAVQQATITRTAVPAREQVLPPTTTCSGSSCSSPATTTPVPEVKTEKSNRGSCGCGEEKPGFWARFRKESISATLMVVKFMSLAFVLEALITLYIPSEWIASLLGNQNPAAIPVSAILGVPVYTSNLTALPMIGGLLSQGMSPGAALSFLIAGPTTTLPAMAAVWGLVKKRIFLLYVSFALVGALVMGFLYRLSAIFF